MDWCIWLLVMVEGDADAVEGVREEEEEKGGGGSASLSDGCSASGVEERKDGWVGGERERERGLEEEEDMILNTSSSCC